MAEPHDTAAHRVLADPSRVAVLEALRRSERPLPVSDLATAVGLHPNTVRAHLALLAEHGYVRGRTEERRTPGRPRLLYTAAPRRTAGGYRMLAEALAAHVAADGGPAEAAAAAGRAHGRRLVRSARSPGTEPKPKPKPATETEPEPEPGPGPGDAAAAAEETDATGAVLRLLDDAGFAPRLDGDRILLHDCPFRDLAEADPTVVCGVHLGLMQGALAELGAPVEVDRLEPFVRPRLCVASLRRPGARPGTAPDPVRR